MTPAMSEYIFNTHSNNPAGVNAHNGAALVITLLETLAELDWCLRGPARPLKLPQYPSELTLAHDTAGLPISLRDIVDSLYESGATRELAVFFDAMQCYAPAVELLDDSAIEAILRLVPSGPAPGYEAVFQAVCDAGYDAMQCVVMNSTLVSLDHQKWNFDHAIVECEGERIEFDHASRIDHVDPIAGRERSLARGAISTRNFETIRQTAFPLLDWGRDVAGQISTFPSEYLRLAFTRLASLDDIVRRWRSSGSAEPDQGNLNFRNESDLTMDKYGNQRRFRSATGEVKTYEQHIWIDQGNRIHFIVDVGARSIEIGYIGTHLRTWKYK